MFTSFVKLLKSSLALFASLAFKPSNLVNSSKASGVNLSLGLTAEATLFKSLLNLLLLYANSLPCCAKSLALLPTPYTAGVIKIDSAPNFNLFANFLAASSLPVSSNVFSEVGDPSNTSPNVPISSTSATKVSPAAPPITPATNLLALAFLFLFNASSAPLEVFLVIRA